MRPSAPTLAVCILTRRGGSFFFFAHARDQSTTDKQVSPCRMLIPYWLLSQVSIRKQATARGGKNRERFHKSIHQYAFGNTILRKQPAALQLGTVRWPRVVGFRGRVLL